LTALPVTVEDEPLLAIKGGTVRNVTVVSFPVEVAVSEVVEPEVVLVDLVGGPVPVDPVLEDLLVGDVVRLLEVERELLLGNATMAFNFIHLLIIEEMPEIVELVIEVRELTSKVQGASKSLLPGDGVVFITMLKIEPLEEGLGGFHLIRLELISD